MMSELKRYTADHRYLLEEAGRACGFTEPIAVDLDEFHAPLLKASKRRQLLPIDGVLVRDWDPNNRSTSPGLQLGMRVYEIQGIRFVRVRFAHSDQYNGWGLDFVAVDRQDYRRLYRIALKCRLEEEPPGIAPVLPDDQLDLLWKNTIGYLEAANLEKIRTYGGRAKRGVLLTGAPGNGKTMACRWIWEACRQRRWEYRLVTPDNYRSARQHDSIEDLFSVERRGIVFFDDMDLALRDRDKVAETEDQAVFLSAMDGIQVNEGVVFVFTTNCSLELIDRAFKRPGRLDLVLNFRAPDSVLRRRLIERWHKDILSAIDIDRAVSSTEGFSFAEVEELKNLLVMHYMDRQTWDWAWALKQFAINRSELSTRPQRQVGFNHTTRSLHGEEVPF
jgi:hypothetical protein